MKLFKKCWIFILFYIFYKAEKAEREIKRISFIIYQPQHKCFLSRRIIISKKMLWVIIFQANTKKKKINSSRSKTVTPGNSFLHPFFLYYRNKMEIQHVNFIVSLLNMCWINKQKNSKFIFNTSSTFSLALFRI